MLLRTDVYSPVPQNHQETKAVDSWVPDRTQHPGSGGLPFFPYLDSASLQVDAHSVASSMSA